MKANMRDLLPTTTRRPRRSEAGYTLIEVMGVIAIMGILMAMLIYGLGSVRRKAYAEGSRATIESLKTAITAYFNEHGEYPPDGYDKPVFRNTGGSSKQIKGSQCLIYYLGFETVKLTEVGSEMRATQLKPFIELTGDMLSGDGDLDQRLADAQTTIVDRFGNEIHYDVVGKDPASGNWQVNEQTASVVYQGETVTAPDPRKPLGGGGGAVVSRNKGGFDIWSNGILPADPSDDITNWK